jgi:Tol biopolymer transport system component
MSAAYSIRCLVAAGSMLCVSDSLAQHVSILSRSVTDTAGVGWSQDARVSADGNHIVFASSANNLVPNDTGGTDIFIRDRAAGTLKRMSIRADGTQSIGAHWHPDLSPDGRFIVFSSDATGLVTPSTTGRHIYLRDRDTDVDGIFDEPGAVSLELISVSGSGQRATGECGLPSVSADGRYIAFQSVASNLVAGDNNGVMDVFVRDRVNGTTVRVSSAGGVAGNGASSVPNISGNGHYVLFHTNADNLVSGDTNQTTDVMRYNVRQGTIERVSVSSTGAQLTTGSVLGSEAIVGPCISADGRHVVFQTSSAVIPGDTNGQIDVYARDMDANTFTRISRRADGSQTAYPCISGTMSSDARFVMFSTSDFLVVDNDTNNRQDIFMQDRDADENGVFDEVGGVSIKRVSVGNRGVQTSLASYGGRIVDGGVEVIFTTTAGNLVPGDTNGFPDVFGVNFGFCPADYDFSGFVDGDDVIAFFSDWSAGFADLDLSGSTDGDDVIAFMTRWDSGC